MTFADADSVKNYATEENLLSDRQLQIVELAVAHVKPKNREPCRKFIEDLCTASAGR